MHLGASMDRMHLQLFRICGAATHNTYNSGDTAFHLLRRDLLGKL
jgi:hypothetical protein